MSYLNDLLAVVREGIRQDRSLDAILTDFPLGEQYRPASGSPLEAIIPVVKGFHRLNVANTYTKLRADVVAAP